MSSDPDSSSRGVDVTDAKVTYLGQAQAGRVEEHDEHAIAESDERGEKSEHLFHSCTGRGHARYNLVNRSFIACVSAPGERQNR